MRGGCFVCVLCGGLGFLLFLNNLVLKDTVKTDTCKFCAVAEYVPLFKHIALKLNVLVSRITASFTYSL